MHRVADTDLFYYSASLESDARVNYRFIRDYEEIRDPRNDRATVSEVYGPEMEIMSDGSVSNMSWMAMPDWRPAAHLEAPSESTPRGRESILSPMRWERLWSIGPRAHALSLNPF